jgi:hypothetical protein
MIQTSAATASAPVADVAVPLGRKPKPPVVVANEPLQMVETRGN